MRYGVVIHGPEAIDSGLAVEVLDRLAMYHQVEATLGGAMGLAALMDAGLEERVRVSERLLVSEALARMGRTSETVVLVNWSKTRESGVAFGRLIWDRIRPPLSVPMVQLDRDFFIAWRGTVPAELASLMEQRGARKVEPPSSSPMADPVRRPIHGVSRGESIWINGTVVGRATSEVVTVGLREGRLTFEGVEVKAHGLEKVRVDSLERAIIRTGSVRRTSHNALVGAKKGGGKLILVDHDAEESIFRALDARAAITVGDDTTRISTALLARLGVPVIGIVDGDEDGICSDRTAAPGTVNIRLRSGNDDKLGARVRHEIFLGRNEIACPDDLGSLVERIASMAGTALIDVRVPTCN